MPDLPIRMSSAALEPQPPAASPGEQPDAAAGAFAALLQGQLLPGVAPELAPAQPPAEPADANAVPEAGAAVDVTGLLAALGSNGVPAANAALPGAQGAANPEIATRRPHASGLPEPLAGIAIEAASGEPGSKPQMAAAVAGPMAGPLLDTAAGTAGAAETAAPSPAQALASPAPAAVAAHPAAQADGIAAPLGSAQWGGELAERIVWMVGRNAGRAEFVLNPPHLGRVEVSLSVTGDAASAVFVSASREVRDAIQQALPQLREALAQAGVALTDAGVNARSEHGGAGDGAPQGARREPMDPPGPPAQHRLRALHGLIDTFA
ncbi:MAG: hypothetical protein Fur0039_16380 [Rhodocyclaceae bacterium]